MANRLEFFKQINSYVDKVYVVTVPRLKERQEHMSELLDGLDFEFIYGTDREKLSQEEIELFYDRREHLRLSRFPRPLRPGEIACALSHLEVYRQAISHGYDRILILEDDVDLVDEHLTQLSDFFQHLPEQWEMAYLGYWKNERHTGLSWIKQGLYVLMRMLGLHKWSIRRILNIYPSPINEYVLKSGNHEGAYAYALTLAGCKKLLAFNQPVKLNADNLFSHLITNRFIKGYLPVDIFFKPKADQGRSMFGSETRK